ncbi:MAG: bacterial transcriptional activator domain-containing protein, partial [Nitrospira sp.]|nr:bacterial transcriptional activator domain-containing protein [Nitrospira sp.]
SLKPDLCWIDTWALDYIAKQSPAQEEDRILKHLTTLVNFYQGPFLPDCEDEAWSFRTRQRLRSLFIRTIYQWTSKITSSSGKERTEPLLSLVMVREPDSEVLQDLQPNCLSRLRGVKSLPDPSTSPLKIG